MVTYAIIDQNLLTVLPNRILVGLKVLLIVTALCCKFETIQWYFIGTVELSSTFEHNVIHNMIILSVSMEYHETCDGLVRSMGLLPDT